jgi:prolyl-tRNA editing enzyme YbaK/EbsC (Cys-tRNA(Pro) deacylase)
MPRLAVRTYFHTRFDRRPDGRIRTEATRVFGRNAQRAVIPGRRGDRRKPTPCCRTRSARPTTELFPPDVCMKTLAVTFVPSRDICLLVGLRLCDRLDFAKLAAAFGVDPRNLKTMDRSAVFGATGSPPGAIGPFSLSAQTNVWLDETIFRAPTIYCGSRELNEVLEISSVALLRLPRVRVARVSAD